MVDHRPRYDVFISYNWRDHAPVENVARALRERGLTVFLDRWYIVPGRPWPQVLEEAIDACRAVAVFLGPQGMGHWQQREKDLALERQSRDPGFSVIPVLLPGADPALGFLSLNTWVDLRTGLDDPLAMSVLAAAARGEAPGPDAQERIRSTLAGVCPYRGLNAFREEDAPFFFGREAFVDRLGEAVEQHTLVALVGASGGGKSSVLRAGLVPLLRRSTLHRVWDMATIVPGDRPLHSLAAALVPLLEPDMTEVDRLAEVGKLAGYLAEGRVALRDVAAQVLAKQSGTDRLLLVVDQWEQLYTLCRDEQVRRRFVDELLEATRGGPLSTALALRGDFFGQAVGYRPLADRLQDGVVNLGPMTREELARAVEAPAQKVGLTFEPGLVSRILDEVEQEPGNLPLLEFLLTDLWEKRQGGHLTHEAYDAAGGVQGAMAGRAEELFGNLPPLNQEEVRRVFTHLVIPGEDTQDTGRRATIDELGEGARPLVQLLADARLLVTGRDETLGEETVEVAHEALISNWTRLRSWLDQDREFLLWRLRLRLAITDWDRAGRHQDTLLRRVSLAEAEGWLTRQAGDLNPGEREYIGASLARRGWERRLRWFGAAAVAGVAVVIAVILVVQQNVAVASRAEAQQQRQAALARELATQARTADSPFLQVLLAVESLRRYSELEGASPLEADQALRQGLALLARPVARMTHDADVTTVAFSPDGKRLASGSWDNTARVWEAATGREVARVSHQGVVTTLAFSPNGRWLATGSADHTARVWETATGQEVTRMTVEDAARQVAFSPDGQWLAGAIFSNFTARVWEAATGREVARMVHDGPATGVAFSPDGAWVASGGDDKSVRVWEARTGREVARVSHEAHVEGGTFSPDGRWLATASLDKTARVWEAATGKPVARLEHGGAVFFVAFSPDGRWLATAAEDKTARLWEVTTGREVARLNHGGAVRSAAFSPNGRLLATGGEESIARLWELATGREVARMTHEGPVTDLAFSPSGEWVATASADRTVRVWDASAGHPATRLVLQGGVSSLDFSRDGRWLATGSFDKTARVWETATGREVTRITLEDDVDKVVFSPDGRRLAAAHRGNTARVWESATGMELARVSHQGDVRDLAFSPDGEWLATASFDHTAKVWEAATGRAVAQLAHGDKVRAVAFSPDGKFLATAGADQTARLWEPATGRPVAQMAHGAPVRGLAFSPDGKLLATGGDENLARIWEVPTGREVARMTHQAFVNDLAFSPNGRWLATASGDRTARLWEAATGREVALVVHEDQVTHLAFSPDSRCLATTGRNRIIRVWEAATGREVARIAEDGQVSDLSWSPDGRRLAAASFHGTAHLWLVWPEDLIAEACTRTSRNLTVEEWRRYFGDEAYQPTCAGLPTPNK
jgi:WD40 repeat protein